VALYGGGPLALAEEAGRGGTQESLVSVWPCVATAAKAQTAQREQKAHLPMLAEAAGSICGFLSTRCDLGPLSRGDKTVTRCGAWQVVLDEDREEGMRMM
jgi:hypothetical protein